MAVGQFRSYVWDPVLIVSQIISFQCLFYLCLGVFLLIVDYSSGSILTLDQFFGYEEINFSTSSGKMAMIAFCLNSLTGAVGLWVIVRRAKQCLDFAATAHLLHFICCCIYAGFPSSWSWWLLNLVCLALMAVTGEFICMRTEMNAIPITVVSKSNI